MVHRKYHALIREHCGKSAVSFEGFRGLKVPVPHTFSGSVDTEEFDDWLLNVLHWITLSNISGASPDNDCKRLVALGSFLEDDSLSHWTSLNENEMEFQRCYYWHL